MRKSGTSALTAAGLRGSDFGTILSGPWRTRGKHFSLHWRASEAPRLGLVVARKFAGTAVKRNLVKRQARAVFGEWVGRTGFGSGQSVDVVVRLTADARALARAAQFDEMRRLFSELSARCAGSAS